MTKPFIVALNKDSVHPFTGERGWAQMIVKFKDEATEEAFTTAAAHKGGWKLLITDWDADPHDTGEQLPMCLYYKPAARWDRNADNWIDPHPWPYPGDWI